MNYDYYKFLKILKETKGINNSLNDILKYDFIYNSNKIDGSNFTLDTLQLLKERHIVSGTHNLDDIKETLNSFITFDLVMNDLGKSLTVNMIMKWHETLMYRTRFYDIGLSGVVISNKFNFLSSLIHNYNTLGEITLDDILKFHLEFEMIHPFQFGNGKIARFIFLKQLLENQLPLKYMNEKTANEYKKALDNSKKDNLTPLTKYINSQVDFIYENKNMF